MTTIENAADSNDPVQKLMQLEQEQLGDVCRDFLRNVCRRGSVCRYRHPDTAEAEELGKKIEYVFCHDYQNRECRRQNCRFLHCTKQEEEVYRATGKMPPHVLEKLAANKAQDMGGGGAAEAAIPICKDFLKGECRRGTGRCKFRHITQAEADMEMRGMHATNGSNSHPIGPAYGMQPGLGGPMQGLAAGLNRFPGPGQRPVAYSERPFDGFAPPDAKRRALDNGQAFSSAVYPPYAEPSRAAAGLSALGSGHEYDVYGGVNSAATAAGLNAASLQTQASLYNNTRYLEEENTALRRRIDELKKQVADLMATNEFLLEQNAQLRNLNKGAPLPPSLSQAPAGQAAPPPPISIADMIPNAATLAASGLPISSIAAALSTSVTSSAPLVSYPIMASSIPQSVSDRLSNIPHSLAH